MTVLAVHIVVSSRQWEPRGAVIKFEVRISRRVTGQTGIILIKVADHALVFFIGFRIHVAIDASHLCIIGWIAVTIDTLVPFSFMLAAVDREIPAIVIKSGGHPGGLTVTGSTILRKLRGAVIRILALVVIRLMAADAGIGRIVVVLIVAAAAIVFDEGMGSLQRIKLIVDIETGRSPAGCGRMATDAIGRDSQFQVARILTLLKVLPVAIETHRRGSTKSRGVAFQTVYTLVSSCQGECGGIVIKLKIRISRRMAGQTGIVLISISHDALVLLIGFRVQMAGNTGKF